MASVYHAAAILLSAFLVYGVCQGMLWRGQRARVVSMMAWSGVVGGGVYGLGLFDSGLVPDFSWWSLGIVIGGTLATVAVIAVMGKGTRNDN